MKRFDIATKEQLAKQLAVAPREIVQIAAERGRHYRCRMTPKTNGEFRLLRVPEGPLKLAQQKIKRHILDLVPPLDCVHGGVKGRSIVTNAHAHVGQDIIFSLDIKDFFPSVNPDTIRAVFGALGFASEAADLLVQLTTWDSQLPQGAPTSTGLANLAMTRIDVRLETLASRHNFTYTRYVDDLYISGARWLLKFRNLVQKIVQEEGFQIKPEKTRTMHAGMRQVVTTIVVNNKLNLPREARRKIREAVLDFAIHGDSRLISTEQIRGQLSWLGSVNPEMGARLRAKSQKP